MKPLLKSSLSSSRGWIIASNTVALSFTLWLMGCSPSPNVPNQTTTASNAQDQTADAAPPSANIDQADAAAAESTQAAAADERLGTKWGDDVSSKVTTVDLSRVSDEPAEQIQVYYADKDYKGRSLNSMSVLSGKVDFSIDTDSGKLPMFRHDSRYYVRGRSGQAYRLVYHNNSANTYEVVASVDGLDVIDGSEASRYSSGYVLSPYDDLVIEGFRKSDEAVASFIFSKPSASYAANSEAGSINNTGVIGTVFYELYDPNAPRTNNTTPQAFPADNGYAKPPK